MKVCRGVISDSWFLVQTWICWKYFFFSFCHKSGCPDCHSCPVSPFASRSTRTVPNEVDYFLSFQFSSVAQSCLTLRLHELQHTRPPSPSPTPGAHPNSCPLSQWCHPTILSSPSPPAFNLSQSVFSDELVLCIRWPTYCSFSFNISPSSEYSGLISFRID